ncbi:MAG: transcriptional repressor [Acidobacteriota bacterium]|nr:transcriptional repressor [Acidobacteriota bacterium]
MPTTRKNTQQRQAIRSALQEADRPLSPTEVLEAAQTEAPTLGIATVYRNLRTLMEDGWLQSVGLPGNPDRYEIAGKEHHHHFHCRGCDRLFEVADCPGDLQSICPQGFALDDHKIILYGHCSDCSV